MKNENVSKIAVVYARYSSSGQREESIQGQLSAARRYADAKGYTIIHEYCDRAKTGTNDNREAFQKMLADTAKHSFGVIIVWKVDRFGRNREEITFNKYKCKKNGVHVEYVAENVSEGPEGVILESVLEGMAEYYSLQLSQNVKRGLYENAKQHKAVSGNVPLGYKLTPDKHFEIDPETAPLVKLIFSMYADGHSITEINEYLNRNGYTTPRGKQFGRTSLDKLLRNEKYIGIYEYKDIRDEDAVPAIVDRDVFERVQEMLSENRRKPSHRWDYDDYILTGKLFCGECGDAMVGRSGRSHTGTKHAYYYCKGHMDGIGCQKKPVRRDTIEDRVIREVLRILNDDEVLEWIAEQTWQYYLRQDDDETEKRALENELKETEKSLDNLLRSVEQGMPYDLVKVRIEELQASKNTITASLAELSLDSPVRLTKDHIVYFLQRFRTMDVQDRKAQKKLIEVFVNAIYLYDDGRMKIAFNYTETSGIHTVTLEDITEAEIGESSQAVHQPTLNCTGANLLLDLSWIRDTFVVTYQLG